jgi:protein TonB
MCDQTGTGNPYNLAMKTARNLLMLAAFLSPALGFCDDPKAVSVNAASLHLISKVEPQYSQLAKMAHIQGDVVIAITVTETGAVTKAKVLSGAPLLIQAALDAVQQWQYEPYMIGGKPTVVATVVKVTFSLGDSPEQVKKDAQAANEFFAVIGQCRRQLNDKQLSQAELTCKKAIVISRGLDSHRHLERAEAFQQTGHALFLQRKFSEALDNYRAELQYTGDAEREGSELAAAHYHVGNALWGIGHLDEAKAEYETAENMYVRAWEHIDSAFLKNEYSKRRKLVLSDHAALLRVMGQSAEAAALDRQAAAIEVKTDLKE